MLSDHPRSAPALEELGQDEEVGLNLIFLPLRCTEWTKLCRADLPVESWKSQSALHPSWKDLA